MLSRDLFSSSWTSASRSTCSFLSLSVRESTLERRFELSLFNELICKATTVMNDGMDGFLSRSNQTESPDK